MPTPPPVGIDVDRVTSWLVSHVTGVEPPLSFDLYPGGRSNLTYRVADATGRTWVLRRPPTGEVLATAHDMAREHRIMAALAGTDVPVPAVVGLCTDDTITGTPFYVMEFVHGLVIRDVAAGRRLPMAARRRSGAALAETLASIHAIDPAMVGLGDLGRTDRYLARQLRRWSRQYEVAGGTDRAVIEARRRLAGAVPAQGAAAIVHGDFRLDNCMVDPAGEVVAVLDWELCTLGDPLADLGMLMVYWAEPGDPFTALPDIATVLDGFSQRDELLAAYESASGRTIPHLDYYVAFGRWKLACILQGVTARYQAGAMGDAEDEALAELVGVLGEASLAALDGRG